MAKQKQVWEWDSLKDQQQLPRWVELTTGVIGAPVVLIGLYLMLATHFDEITSGALIAIIVTGALGFIYFADGSSLNKPRRLIIRIDSKSIMCSFLGRHEIFNLGDLDWDRVEITNAVNCKLVLAKKGDPIVCSYQIMMMDKSRRRELWRELTRYKPDK